MNKLFSKFEIQGHKLKNRLIALPVFTGYALPDGRVSPLMLEHYRRLAKSGVAVVVVPNVAVSINGRTSDRSLVLDHDKYIEGLQLLSHEIKEYDALACIQLNHAGRYAVTEHPFLPSPMHVAEITKSISVLKNFMESFPFLKRFGLTAHVAKMTAGWTNKVADSDIDDMIKSFGEAASRAIQAGFDIIELHGATGYLIAQFLSARTNRRSPPWGGSAEMRMRFALKIIDDIKSRLSDNIPVGFRLILDEMIHNGISFQDSIKFAEKLQQHGIAYLSATVGTYQSVFNPDVVKQLSKPAYLANMTKTLKAHVDIPVIISGRIVSPKLAEKILRNEEADLIGLGRPLLADPEWVKKAQNNEGIIGCKNCNTCFRNVVLGESLICEQWPKVIQDRIKLETRFISRNAYRTLIILSSLHDLKIARYHIQQIVPKHKNIFDRVLFLNTEKQAGFLDASRRHAVWCEHYFRKNLKRGKIESVFIDDFQDPADVIYEQLQDNFGIVSFVHDEKSKWKNRLLLMIPSDIVVFRAGQHANLKKVLIPCDLSDYTLMQIRVALHAFQGRSNVEFQFVHITSSSDEALGKWNKIIEKFELSQSSELKIIKIDKGATVAELLLKEVRKGDYGSVIIGRQGGLAHVRRKIFGSVSEQLLRELPECSFIIVG